MNTFLICGDAEFKTEAEARAWALDKYGWEADPKDLEGRDILVVGAQYDSYEGVGFFLLRDRATGKFYEVHGGHCSCNGFEGQFNPEECTLDYLLSEKFSFYDLGGDGEKEKFLAFVRELEASDAAKNGIQGLS